MAIRLAQYLAAVKSLGVDAWLPGFLSVISLIGSAEFNGLNWIHYPMDFVVIILGAVIFYFWGINSHIISKYFRKAARVNDKVKMPAAEDIERDK